MIMSIIGGIGIGGAKYSNYSLISKKKSIHERKQRWNQ